MNELERLSFENRKNYLLYLKRMTESMKVSTKGLIPVMCYARENILDVGCGSGVLLKAIEEINPNASLTGIDLNGESIKKLMELKNKWQLYQTDLMNLKKEEKMYDTIIFSSVLHEVSSYYADMSKRFTNLPILDCFKKSNELLMNDGYIILRDGLMIDKQDWNEKYYILFKNINDSYWLYRFQKDFRGFDKIPELDTSIRRINNYTFEVGLAFLKEFLYTFTWGKESYNREINERFGILDKDSWLELLDRSGFYIDTVVESKEEYEKYLAPKIEVTNLNGDSFRYPMMTILIKAKKIKHL